ncbi:MAG: EipA family protein [Pseudomonadota bacterium]
MAYDHKAHEKSARQDGVPQPAVSQPKCEPGSEFFGCLPSARERGVTLVGAEPGISLSGIARFSIALLAMSLIAFPGANPGLAQTPNATTCTADDFNKAIDAAGLRLRDFNNKASPQLNGRIKQLKTAKGWGSDASDQRAMDYLRDARIASLDVKAGNLLARLDALGQAGEADPIDCSKLADLEATGLELLAVMKAKLAHTEQKIATELSGTQTATASVKTDPGAGAPAIDPFLGERTKTAKQPEPVSEPKVADAPAEATVINRPTDSKVGTQSEASVAGVVGEPASARSTAALDPLKGTLTEQPAEGKAPAAATSPKLAPAAKTKPDAPAIEKPSNTPTVAKTKTQAAPAKAAPVPPPANWSTQTERAEGRSVRPRDDLIALNRPYLSNGSETATGAPGGVENGGVNAALQDGIVAEPQGYTIDEIRNASKGFFGTLSASLAGVIEHAFKNWGQPTAYILGTEGGGAFLAGLRYGEGKVYPRFGEAKPIYWHGPSLGYDFGAAGSQTLILVYSLERPEDLMRSFTGLDGSAYLVGGVGLTVLKGGPVVMTPIRTGLGLRLGANVGYLRFTDQPTWNPF